MRKSNQTRKPSDVRPEYDLSKLTGAVRGKYTKQFKAGTNLAKLEPDVRAAFPTDSAVNRALRTMIKKPK